MRKSKLKRKRNPNSAYARRKRAQRPGDYVTRNIGGYVVKVRRDGM